MEEFDYSSHPNIVYPSLSWIADVWNVLNLSFDVWGLLNSLYSYKLYTVFNIILDYLDENDIETKFTDGLVYLWTNACKNAPIQFLEHLLTIVFATVPEGYKVVYRHLPVRGEDFVREYLEMMGDFYIIPKKGSEENIWLIILLKQYPSIVIDFIKKYNIELSYNKSDIIDLIQRVQSRKTSVEEFSEILRVLGIRSEKDIASIRSYMSRSMNVNEDVLTDIVLHYIEHYGRPPLPEECITHQDFDEFTEAIENGDKDGIKRFFDKLNYSRYRNTYTLLKSIIPQVVFIINKDDVDTFKVLIDYTGLDNFYLVFLYMPEVLCGNYKISEYLLSEWENTPRVKFDFWKRIWHVTKLNKNDDYLTFLSEYKELFEEETLL